MISLGRWKLSEGRRGKRGQRRWKVKMSLPSYKAELRRIEARSTKHDGRFIPTNDSLSPTTPKASKKHPSFGRSREELVNIDICPVLSRILHIYLGLASKKGREEGRTYTSKDCLVFERANILE